MEHVVCIVNLKKAIIDLTQTFTVHRLKETQTQRKYTFSKEKYLSSNSINSKHTSLTLHPLNCVLAVVMFMVFDVVVSYVL